MVFHDGWTTTDAGCRRYGDGTDDSASLANALYCERLSWRGSREAALRSALIYANQGQAIPTRRVLTPFEGIDDPRTLYILGWADVTLGDTKRALEEYRRAFEAVRNVNDIRIRANAATQYAQILNEETDYAESVRILNALLHSPGAENLGLEFVRDCYLNMARALDDMGDGPAAAAELERLKLRLGTVPMLARELTAEARLHIERGELQSAEELALRAQKVAGPGERAYAAEAIMERLRIALKRGDGAHARELLAELESYDDVLTIEHQGRVAELRGLASRAAGKLEESRSYFERALALHPPSYTVWTLEYELGVTLQAAGRSKEARRAFEASISEVNAQRGALGEPGLQPALMANRQQPYDALFDLLAESGDAVGALSVLEASLASRLDDNIVTATESTGSTVDDALRRSEARRTLGQARAGIPRRPRNPQGQNVHFAAFVTSDNHAWALIRAGGHTELERIGLSPTELCALMEKFGEDFDDATAVRLGKTLFPAARLARLGPRFAVILPVCARNFPVAALRIGAGRLIDEAAVSVAPDVSTVVRLHEDRDQEVPTGDVFADPKGDLPAARREAEWTGRTTGAFVRLGDMASETTLESLGFRQLLHFATHTEVDVAGPALVLADKNLTVADILRHRIRADLVVLASCHSGSSLRTTAAETLSTAFLRAGSGAVLATLRSVEDRAAFDVIRAFYEAGGLADPAGALARVQRKLAHSEPPSQWAAFFVAGSAEALTSRGAVRLAQHSGR